MDPISLKEYSIWLMPEGEEIKPIKYFFDDIRNRVKTISFEPHVTLLGGLTLSESKIIEKIDELAVRIAPFKITFTEIGETESFYKFIFLKCKETQEFITANELVQKSFATDVLYAPHMSIVYGDIDSIAKKEILNLIDPLDIRSFSFTVRSLFLYKTFGEADQWELIHRTSIERK